MVLLLHARRVGIELPKIEIRYEELSVQADAFVASRALPTLSNSAINFLQARTTLDQSQLSPKITSIYIDRKYYIYLLWSIL